MGPDGARDRTRLFVYNGGFLTQGRVRRILDLAGYDIRVGVPGAEGDDLVGVWGQSPTSGRGEAVAQRRDAHLLRVEDGFLRSVHTGRQGAAPMGLLIDRAGVHFDPATRSDLETILAEHPLDDSAVLSRARHAIDWIRTSHLSKYNAFAPEAEVPEPGYVLILDQTRDDASIRASRADRNTFLEMLFLAREEHPGARLVVKSHPETLAGEREGYFAEVPQDVEVIARPVSPWRLMEGAVAVYTVSSQMGFEAILAGHRPVVMGQPFYAGWGLTDDRTPLDRRQRKLTRAQLFAGAMIHYPVWYDPFRDRLCQIEDVLGALEASARAWREDHRGWVATNISRWKRPHFRAFFGQDGRLRFKSDPIVAVRTAHYHRAPIMSWAARSGRMLDDAEVTQVEDGFLRSRGLGAALTPPLSLVTDPSGIYYDPTRPSTLEEILNASDTLTEGERARAARLLRRLIKTGLSKYNLDAAPLPPLPDGRRILVPGQVEDDASILTATGEVRTNRALLQAVSAANPAAVLIYKPHPDVAAGLRKGHLPDADTLADVVVEDADPIALIDAVDEVWTMTSLLGFEALLRDKRVVCLGQPFYSGWGLTEDRASPIARRTARPDLVALVHAALVAYPRYVDPVTGAPCPVEVAVDRLAQGDIPAPGGLTRALSFLQALRPRRR